MDVSQDTIQFKFFKTRLCQIISHSLQLFQLPAKQFAVPSCRLGDLIVCNAVCFDLLIVQVLGHNARNLVKSKLQRRLVARVSRDNDIVPIYDDWHLKPKLLNAFCDRSNCAVVFSWILFIGMNKRKILINNLLFHTAPFFSIAAGEQP